MNNIFLLWVFGEHFVLCQVQESSNLMNQNVFILLLYCGIVE